MKSEIKHDAAPASENNNEVSEVSLSINVDMSTARSIVQRNCLIAGGCGIIPIPLADWAAVSAVQTLMLRQLCEHYDVPYHKARASRYIGALAGGWITTNVGYTLASFIKVLPVIGFSAVVAVPAAAYASTYALGEIFIPHFESGGNLFTFDPKAHTALFAYYFNKGKAASARMAGKSYQAA